MSNLLSFRWPSCCCVFLSNAGILPMWFAGQISTRIGFIKTIPVVSVYVSLLFICFIVTIVGGALKRDLGAVYIIPAVFVLAFVVVLRFKFAAFFQIEENCCQLFCTGFWCAPCSLCQMGRHLYGYSKQFDGDGDVEGGMIYGGTPVNV
jgi:PLAC8 family